MAIRALFIGGGGSSALILPRRRQSSGMAATAVDRPFGGGGMRERAIWASGGAEAQPRLPLSLSLCTGFVLFQSALCVCCFPPTCPCAPPHVLHCHRTVPLAAVKLRAAGAPRHFPPSHPLPFATAIFAQPKKLILWSLLCFAIHLSTQPTMTPPLRLRRACSPA